MGQKLCDGKGLLNKGKEKPQLINGGCSESLEGQSLGILRIN